MSTTRKVLITLAAVLLWISAPVWAQRGQGRGSAGHSAGGRPSIGSWPPQSRSGQSGTHRSPDADHPDSRSSRSADNPPRRAEDHNIGRPESKRDSGQPSLSEHLAQSPKLSSKLQGFFPAGTNLAHEAEGFKNLGDFVSTAHVSHNLGIPFGDLKTRMMNGQKLGDAIHQLKPDVNYRAEEKKAREQARKDLREAESNS